jgi:hypothetical protein
MFSLKEAEGRFKKFQYQQVREWSNSTGVQSTPETKANPFFIPEG